MVRTDEDIVELQESITKMNVIIEGMNTRIRYMREVQIHRVLELNGLTKVMDLNNFKAKVSDTYKECIIPIKNMTYRIIDRQMYVYEYKPFVGVILRGFIDDETLIHTLNQIFIQYYEFVYHTVMDNTINRHVKQFATQNTIENIKNSL